MDNHLKERVIQVISDVMNIPVGELSIDSSPESVSQWESMKHINLILALEEEFGVQFDDEQIASMQDINSIISGLETSV